MRTILHSDLNCFYASVEMMLEPGLRGKAVAVCGDPENRHGIVLTKSQRAKEAGVKTGMANWEARQLCPDIIIVPPRYDEYIKYSRLVREIYGRYTDLVEPFGMDECWLDVTESRCICGSGADIAEDIRRTVKSELGLTVSVGVSFNKIFAKLGSDMKKPDAVTIIPADDFKSRIWPLPAGDLLGVGRATEARLNKRNIRTIGDIAGADPRNLHIWFGINGLKLWRFARGEDTSRVMPSGYEREALSIGHGITCYADLLNAGEVRNVLLELSQGVSHRLRQAGVAATRIQLFIRGSDLCFTEYQSRVPFPTQSWRIMTDKAMELFNGRYDWRQPVRALTIRAVGLVDAADPVQLDLFTDYDAAEKEDALEQAMDDIRRRFGHGSIQVCSTMRGLKMVKDEAREQISMPGCMYV